MNRTRIYILVAAVSLIAVFVLVFVLSRLYFKSLQQVHIKYYRSQDVTSTIETAPRILDGILVSTSTINPALVGVMIENNKDGRPAAGLYEARVVYEVPTEVDITRFLALYTLEELPNKIGPVRSARPYFLKLLSEWGRPLFLHVGGSADALSTIRTGHTNDFDEYFNERFYWRDKKRAAPFNVYTSRELIASSMRATTTDFFGWQFESGQVAYSSTATSSNSELRIIYKKPDYEVTWVYDKSKNLYNRLQAGQLHRDEGGDIISASTVVVQKVSGKVIDDVGRVAIDLQGEGELLVLKHGEAASGKWKRGLGEPRTRFFAQDETEILLAPGKVWVEIVLPWHKVITN
jgi:hypothetical protein